MSDGKFCVDKCCAPLSVAFYEDKSENWLNEYDKEILKYAGDSSLSCDEWEDWRKIEKYKQKSFDQWTDVSIYLMRRKAAKDLDMVLDHTDPMSDVFCAELKKVSRTSRRGHEVDAIVDGMLTCSYGVDESSFFADIPFYRQTYYVNKLLVRLRNQPNMIVRERISRTFGNIGEPAVRKDVIDALCFVMKGRENQACTYEDEKLYFTCDVHFDPHDHSRQTAAWAMGRIGRLARDGKNGICDQFKNNVTPVLTEAIKTEKNAGIREASARALGEMGSNAATKDVVIILKKTTYMDNEPYAETRKAAVWSLGEIGKDAEFGFFSSDPEDIKTLYREDVTDVLTNVLLKDSDEGVRAEAAEALGKIGEKADAEKAVTALITRFDPGNEPSELVRCNSIEATRLLLKHVDKETYKKAMAALVQRKGGTGETRRIVHVKKDGESGKTERNIITAEKDFFRFVGEEEPEYAVDVLLHMAGRISDFDKQTHLRMIRALDTLIDPVDDDDEMLGIVSSLFIMRHIDDEMEGLADDAMEKVRRKDREMFHDVLLEIAQGEGKLSTDDRMYAITLLKDNCKQKWVLSLIGKLKKIRKSVYTAKFRLHIDGAISELEKRLPQTVSVKKSPPREVPQVREVSKAEKKEPAEKPEVKKTVSLPEEPVSPPEEPVKKVIIEMDESEAPLDVLE